MNIDKRLDDIIDCLFRLTVKAVVVQDQKILLVKESAEGWWGLPGGGVDHGESLQVALDRELSEELGIGDSQFSCDYRVDHVEASAIIDKIPRVHLFYRVTLSPESIKSTEEVEATGWFSLEDIQGLKLSPTAACATDYLYPLLKK